MEKKTQKIINQSEGIDLNDNHLSKIKGEPKFGAKVSIKWADRDSLDEGYIFSLPEMDDDPEMLDFLIHVPSPDNSDGMDNAPGEWAHVKYLLSMDDVLTITIKSN